MECIWIVEDDPQLQEILRYNLEKLGFSTQIFETAEACLSSLIKGDMVKPSLLLLDIMLPGMNGIELCSKIRSMDDNISFLPIIMLTALGQKSDIVSGLDVGADDYLAKPFDLEELVARVRAVLRRSELKKEESSSDTILSFDGLVLDRERFSVSCDGEKLELSKTQFLMLECLMLNSGKVLSRKAIVRAVHGSNYPATDRSVDVQILHLRRLLGRYSSLIETVRGVGYRFVPLQCKEK